MRVFTEKTCTHVIKHLLNILREENCAGDSTFHGQGLNAVAFSGFACAHRIRVDLGLDRG
ncbi:Carotenoid cis-trans isomerase [Richelia intracellularis]|nr:Carotenoid cis-trans isomerase [Richelia intracellularis]